MVGGGGDQVDDFDALLPAACGGSPQLGDLGGASELGPARQGRDVDDLDGAVARLPCPRWVFCDPRGTFAQGSFFRAANSVGRLALTVKT